MIGDRRQPRYGWRWGLLICTSVGVVTCSKAQFTKVGALDGGGTPRDAARQGPDTPDVPSVPGACAPGTTSRSKGKAQACSCDDECQTGFCADGICCSSACGETCKACNLASSLGDCAFVPAGGKPSDLLSCAASKPATCGQDGTCDGKGGCRVYVPGTECKPGRCDGDRVTDIQTCDGKGQCSQSVSRTCPPYTCDPATNRCATTCTTNAACASGQECVAGRCGKSANGASCQSAADCSSGFCVDALCCNIACSGACVSCDQTGAVGHCTFVPAGLPDPECPSAAPNTCNGTGLCDGAGSCTLYPENTVCGASSCAGLVENTPRTCDGQGTCRDSQLVDCAPFLCSTGACQTSCDPTQSDSCETGHQCVAQSRSGVTTGICGQRKNGQTCTDASDCESAVCVDGVCCESTCAGACRSCNLPGSPGRCLDVASGAPDPRKTCQDKGASACSTNGLCDGQGACQAYPSGTSCGSQSCVGGAYNPPSTCNASGQCVASRSRTCNPFACNGDICFTSCSTSAECATGEFCISGSCGLKPRGAECATGKDCTSGLCAQGVCCDTACTGACMACDLTASAGTCTAVADRAPDPQGKCATTASASCGTTGTCLKGACAYYAQGLNCANAACATSASITPTSTCDGKGACTTPANQSCGTFLCAAGACKTSCTPATEATDCVPPNTCVNNSCGLKVNGAACTNASQCASGFCTEGVCCNTACADATSGGLCKTCKGTQTVTAGTCGNVESGTADPKSRCSKSVVASGDCSNDGTCNGSGACRPWSSSTGCRQESCTVSTHTLPATCDGAGNCPAAVVSSCGSYVCKAGSPTCLNTCLADTDCTGGLTCLKTTNRCGDKLAAGESCVANSDCGTGLVCAAEGVCCDKTCASGCQSCKLTGKAGVCSNIAGGSPPRATTPVTCAAATTGACGNSGNCDSSAGCEQRATCTSSITACPSDTHQQYIASGLCSVAGVCGPQTAACSTGYLCVAGGACATSCTSANASANCDVAKGYSCIGGFCQKKASGTICATGLECANGNCVDGLCCASASCNVCQSCNLAGHLGTCWNVPANSADGTCTGTCPSPTQANGLCDGAGACKPNSTCAAGFLCAAGICATSCTGDAQCAAGFACAPNGSCKRAAGQACGGQGECASGNCVDGVCCASASCTDCLSCNVTGHEGACFPVSASTADGACVATCVGSQLSGLCDGTGTCRLAAACPGGYLCNNSTQCAVSCTTSCASGYYCASGACAPVKANGQTCATGGECSSGHCVDGFCCGSASCTDCLSCNVGGHQGTCFPVAAGAADGVCVASCVGSQLSGLCDGNGTCRPAAACPGGYLCNTNNTQCAASCTTSCAAGFYCAGSACVPIKANGLACASGAECSTGQCVDGFCCASASCDPCLSCNVGGHEGTCFPVAAGAADGACVAQCPAGGNQESGLCDGSGACRKASACPGGNLCGTNNQCSADCTTVGCTAGFYCSTTTCLPLKADGSACGGPSECTHGQCISGGSGSICCSTACTDVTCGSQALCNPSGIGCQTHAEGSACTAGQATCSSDGHSSLAGTGTCASGACQPTATPCLTGYLCVGSACVTPGGCTATSGCDTAYTCNTGTGNCE